MCTPLYTCNCMPVHRKKFEAMLKIFGVTYTECILKGPKGLVTQLSLVAAKPDWNISTAK